MTWCLLLLSHGAKEILGVWFFWSFHSHPPGSAKKIIDQQNGWTSKQFHSNFLKGDSIWFTMIHIFRAILAYFGIVWHVSIRHITSIGRAPDASHWLRRPHSFRLGHPHQDGGAKGCKDRFQNIAIMIPLIHIDSHWMDSHWFTLIHIVSGDVNCCLSRFG